MASKLRIGCVPYLNVLPLIRGLETRADVELVHRVPSELSRLLAAEEIDVGIVPIVEYLRGVGEAILPGMSISSRGPVRSVLVFLGCPAAEVETLAADTSSRSSAALAQVIFRKRYGIDPVQVPCPPDLDAMLSRAHAALLIGDPALAAESCDHDRLDLGEGWFELTGLPFTFAPWVVRKGAPVRELTEILQAAKAAGVGDLHSLAADAARERPFSAELIESYLSVNTNHDLSDDHLRGIERFATYAEELGIIPTRREVRVAQP